MANIINFNQYYILRDEIDFLKWKEICLIKVDEWTAKHKKLEKAMHIVMDYFEEYVDM